MKKKDLEYFKRLLLEKRRKLLEQVGYLEERALNSTTTDSSGELSAYPFHMADQGTDADEREKAFLFASREGRYLYHLDKALERIENGSYGKCRACGGDINIERLKAVPHATMCIECKSKEEQEAFRRRPIKRE
ncbi:MAG TPA: TraR/DksA family transcriptional regulator [Candidatus Latescibacteria bacterium]|nr:TraR/DksA family transcriptional regulator [Candidatus Latescibacterota bacterium]